MTAPVAPLGTTGRAYQSVATLLANCTEVQAMLGAATAADALAQIDFGRAFGAITPPRIFIKLGNVSLPQIALDTHGLSLEVTAWICWPFSATAQTTDTPADRNMRAFNRMDVISQQMIALVASRDPIYPARLDELMIVPPMLAPDDDQELKGCWESNLSFKCLWST